MAWLEWHLALCLISGERHTVIVDRGGEWRPGVLFLVFSPMLSSSSPSYLSSSLLSLALCLSLPSQHVCLPLFITWPHLHGHNKAPGIVQGTSVAQTFVCAFKSSSAFMYTPSVSRFLYISNHIPFGLWQQLVYYRAKIPDEFETQLCWRFMVKCDSAGSYLTSVKINISFHNEFFLWFKLFYLLFHEQLYSYSFLSLKKIVTKKQDVVDQQDRPDSFCLHY